MVRRLLASVVEIDSGVDIGVPRKGRIGGVYSGGEGKRRGGVRGSEDEKASLGEIGKAFFRG